MTTPIPGITPENYHEIAKAFVVANGGTGFFIVRRDIDATTEFPPTPRQWGAWMGYFHSRRIPNQTFLQRGRGTVPAEWPHLFDADWQRGNDDQAADLFESKVGAEQRRGTYVIDATARRNTVKTKLGHDPSQRDVPRYGGMPPRVDISDFPNR